MELTHQLDRKVLTLLNNPDWYSLATSAFLDTLNIQVQELAASIDRLRTKAGHKINVFSYNGRQYIGLEHRRLDYERDKRNGVNHVERWIKEGVYD